MKQGPGIIFTLAAVILCGCPGMLTAMGGGFVTVFGLLADKAQLKLDTNLDKASVIWTGLGGLCLGVVLVAIPVVIWLWSRRR